MGDRLTTTKRRRRGATLLILLAVLAGMSGLTAASVPLYRIFCGATGFGGTTQRAQSAPSETSTALVKISFDAQTAPGLRWEFRPLTPAVSVHPGAQTEVFFRAVNHSATTVTATPLSDGTVQIMALSASGCATDPAICNTHIQ